LRFKFKYKRLLELYQQDKGASSYPPRVVDAFSEVVQYIEAALNEQDIRVMKGYRFEKLKGKRGKQGERSLRLNEQFRLIVKIQEDDEGRYIEILRIEDYH
jgi:proteic killer suppression protein